MPTSLSSLLSFSRSVYVPNCRPADLPTYLSFCIYKHWLTIYLALGLSMCRPADPPLIINIIYIYIEMYLYLLTVLSICRPADPSLILNMHTGLIIGHAGLISSRVSVKARYGVCILFWGVWGGLPPRHRIMTSLLPRVGLLG